MFYLESEFLYLGAPTVLV